MEPWESLALRAQNGDRQAAGELFGRLRPVLMKLARSVQAAGCEAEDLAQIALLRVWERLPRYTHPRPFGAWVKVVGKRIMLSAARHGESLATLEDEDGDRVADRPPGGSATDGLPPWWAWEVLAGLEDGERADISRRFGLSGSEANGKDVARSTGRSEAKVRAGLRESLACVRVAFEARYGLPA